MGTEDNAFFAPAVIATRHNPCQVSSTQGRVPALKPLIPIYSAVLVVALIAAGCAGDPTKEEADDGDWVASLADLGPPLVDGVDGTFADSGVLWFSAEQVLPKLAWDDPAADIPLYMWQVAQQEQIWAVATLGR